MDTKLRSSGIGVVGEISWGTHFCMFYETKEDLLKVLLGYFKAGLENHEFCLWVTSELLSPEEAKQAMREAGIEFDRYLAEGQIEIVSYADWYLAGDYLDTQRVLQDWIHKHDQAIARGYVGLRCTGDTFWLERHQWDSFAKYEVEIDQVVSTLPIIALCTYPLERCSARNILDVVSHHQFTVVKQSGVWENLEGSQLKRAHDEIRQLNADLESRVVKRTAELAAANKQLRQEVTERKRAEQALKESERRYHTMVDQIPAIVYIDNISKDSGVTIFVNPYIHTVLGFTPEEWIDGGYDLWSSCIHPEDRVQVLSEYQRCIQSGQPFDREYRVIARDGRLAWLHEHSTLWTDEEGHPLSMHGITHDITERKQAEEAIRKSEQVLREAESLGHTGSWEQNLVTGEIFNTEENLRLFFGDDRSKGANFEDYAQAVHPDDHEYVLRRRAELLEEEGPSDIEYRVIWPDGSIHVIFGRATVVRNELGQAIRVYGTNVDITERKQAEEEILRHASQMEALAEISQALAEVGLDVQEVFETIVRHAAELIGDTCGIRLLSSDEQWLESVTFHNPNPEVKALMRLLHPITPTSANHSWLTPVLRTGQPLLIPIVTEEQLRRSVQPEYLPFFEQVGLHSLLIVALRVKGRVIGTLGLSRDQPGHPYTSDDQVLLQDLADRASLTIQSAQLFEQVQGAHQRLQVLSSRLVEVQESERKRLAREIHDEFGQSLTALKMDLAWLNDHLPPRSKSLREKVDSALDLTNETIQMTQKLASQLRPRMLDDLGLAAALEWHVSEWSKRTGIKPKITLPEEEWQLNPSLDTALYRVCQEALTNVARHAGASKVEVSLAREGDEVVLTVRDNGRGMDGEKITAPESLGLLGMKERVEQIGGRLEVPSEAGKGTTVVARVPISQPSSYQLSHPAPKEHGPAKKSPKGKGRRRRKS